MFLEKAQKYTESIVETILELLIGLTPGLRVITANCFFYDRFHVTAEESEGRFVYSIGDHSIRWIFLHFFYCEVMDFLINSSSAINETFEKLSIMSTEGRNLEITEIVKISRRECSSKMTKFKAL